jgi:hypothetical protein
MDSRGYQRRQKAVQDISDTIAVFIRGMLKAIIHKRRGGCWRERNTGTGGCDGSERRSWGCTEWHCGLGLKEFGR